MGLGELIEFLEKQDPEKVVPLGFGKPHSYRGIYEDLAFEPVENVTIGEMLRDAKYALGKTFYGYKGGEYTMHEYSDVWISPYGEGGGQKIGDILMRYMVGDL